MGIFRDTLVKSLQDSAPELLQALKDDRSGKITLSTTRRHAAMILLRKVMTAKQINDVLASVPVAPAQRKTPKKKVPKRAKRAAAK
jgi:hypothetical protein